MQQDRQQRLLHEQDSLQTGDKTRTSRIHFRSYSIGYRMSRIVERMSRMATGQAAEAAA